MCGFTCVFAEDPSLIKRKQIERMREAIAHRGPDDSGVEFLPDSGLAIGFARLSIIDLSDGGHQPMWNDAHSVMIAFNGEIYNHRPLRIELQSLGHRFRSASDTEVILRAYEEWGREALQRLDGMFAVAIIDLRIRIDRPSLMIARDRSGEKPLYYSWLESSRTLIFASELKAILRHSDVERRLSKEGLHAYLALGYVPAPYSAVEGVSKLAAGDVLFAQRGSPPRIEPYWRPTRSRAAIRPSDATSLVREILEKSVEERMVADVPVGAFLSGGVDSTIVVGLMRRHSDKPIRTYSAAFDVGPRSAKYNVDADTADRVAEEFGTLHTRFSLRLTDHLGDVLRQVVRHVDEPHANPTLLTTYLLAQHVRDQGTKVILTGDGSDELFGGYVRYQRERWVDRVATLPGPARRALQVLGTSRSRTSAIASLLEKADISPRSAAGYLKWWDWIGPERRRSFLHSRFHLDATPAEDRVEELLTEGAPYNASVEGVAYVDYCLWVADESNMRLDKMTMAHGLESRAPFQDHELVSLALGLPFHQKVGRATFQTKRLLKSAFGADVLPPYVANRSKWGWFSPVHYWVNDFFSDEIRASVSHLVEVDVLDPVVMDRFAHRPSLEPGFLWSLVILSLWHQIYIENE